MRKKISLVLKYLTVLCSLGGLLLSFIYARRDGYSHWLKRLLYFTAQSNIWIGVTVLLILLLPLFRPSKQKRWKERLYLLKYIFTVSITVTGLVFCGFLGPFADASYYPWSFSSILTHALSPAFALADFFMDEYPISLQKKHVFFSAIPPLCYVLLVGALEWTYTDFGRGDPYPYFFMNYRSPVGFFGFSNQLPFFAGSFYWLLILTLIVLGVAVLYARLRSPHIFQKEKSRNHR